MWINAQITAAFLFFYMTAFYLAARRVRNNGLADTAWGPGFVLAAWLNLFLSGRVTAPAAVITGGVTVWGLRLAFHVFSRNRGKAEDFRYAEMRRKWGRRAEWKSYVNVFLIQGLLLFVIAWPIVLVNAPSARTGFGSLEALGALVWAAGFVFESVADRQLRGFIRNRKSPDTPYLTEGLWKVSRHPNYFGEALLWWGIFLLALRSPLGWTGLVSPLLIGFLLRFVSGVPLLEKKHMQDPAYRPYAERTNAFFPWVPKR
jgi:steroid 5-alpha reductase family enzyme